MIRLSLYSVCTQLIVVDAKGLLFNALVFTYSLATFVYVYMRVDGQLRACVHIGWSPCLLILLPAHEQGDPFNTHLTREASN